MIKVGQIRKIDKFIFIVTNIYGTFFGDRAYIIYTQGDAETFDCGYIDNNSRLIAEYPTWRDAINSEEFGGKPHIEDWDDNISHAMFKAFN